MRIPLTSVGDFVELNIQAASTTLSGGGTVTLAGGPTLTSFINTTNLSGAALINQETIEGTGYGGESNSHSKLARYRPDKLLDRSRNQV